MIIEINLNICSEGKHACVYVGSRARINYFSSNFLTFDTIYYVLK